MTSHLLSGRGPAAALAVLLATAAHAQPLMPSEVVQQPPGVAAAASDSARGAPGTGAGPATPPAGVSAPPATIAAPSVPQSALGATTTRHMPPPFPEAEIARQPILQRMVKHGARLYDLGVSEELRGIFATEGNSFQVFYLLPTGGVIGGKMWDRDGADLTTPKISEIPGMVPTAQITVPGRAPAPAAPPPLRPAPSSAEPSPAAVPLLRTTAYGVLGRADAPRLWMVMDPRCPACHKAMAVLKPFVDAGRVQLALVPAPELGQASVPYVLSMLRDPRDARAQDWADNKLAATPLEEGQDLSVLVGNYDAAEALKVEGTPTFFWDGADGKEGRSVGVPVDPQRLIALIRR